MAIDDHERRRREQFVAHARERVEKQGIALTQETEALAKRYIEGELTAEQFALEGLRLYLPRITSH